MTLNQRRHDDVNGEHGYDDNGNVTFVTHRQRFHDETDTGALGTPSSGVSARVSYAAMYYDAINRLTAEVDVGTNAGSAYTRPGSAPSGSSTVLVISYSYNAAGWVQDVTDPAGIVTRSEYDNLGRVVKTIEHYTNGTPTDASNKTTAFGYDGSDHLVSLTVMLPGSEIQETEFVYGVTITSGSAIDSNDILGATWHPAPSTGSADSDEDDRRTVNALGETASAFDRNGTEHAYGYDPMGRLLGDSVMTLGSGVDGAVRALNYAYDTMGNLVLATSYDNTPAIVNQVKREYNGLGQLIAEHQEHDGAVDGSTLAVEYVYSEMPSGANHSRLIQMIYPNGRVLHFGYNSGLDASISRLSFLADDSSGSPGTHLEELSYVGLGTVVIRAHPEPDVDLTYLKQGAEGTGDAGDQYTGLDRFPDRRPALDRRGAGFPTCHRPLQIRLR